mgnify:CR=1 FL=1
MAREVGTEGKLGGQAQVPGVGGHVEGPDRQRELRWPSNLTAPGAQHRRGDDRRGARRPVAQDHGGRARRDPRAEEHHQHDGGPAATRSPREVTRVAREVGTEGKLGGQAAVPGVAGTWKDLTDNVNSMAIEPHRPGAQHRRSDHRRRQRRPVAARSRWTCAARSCELKETINTMVDQLRSLRRRSDARGARGGHRGQARRPGHRAGRRGHVEGSHRQRELRWPSTSPARCATSPR